MLEVDDALKISKIKLIYSDDRLILINNTNTHTYTLIHTHTHTLIHT